MKRYIIHCQTASDAGLLFSIISGLRDKKRIKIGNVIQQGRTASFEIDVR